MSSKCLQFYRPDGDPSSTGVAIYAHGFQHGKHVFACMWPRSARYVRYARLIVGFGRESSAQPLDSSLEDTVPVGGTQTSFGFDLLKNRLVHAGKTLCTYPRDQARNFCLPTLFYMYLDLDDGRLYFGCEQKFWGAAFSFQEHMDQLLPTFPMLAVRGVHGKFMMFYKGQGEQVVIAYKVKVRRSCVL